MCLDQIRAHVLVEVLANFVCADLDAGPKAHIDEAHQHQLPRQAGSFRSVFADAVLGQRAAVRGIVSDSGLFSSCSAVSVSAADGGGYRLASSSLRTSVWSTMRSAVCALVGSELKSGFALFKNAVIRISRSRSDSVITRLPTETAMRSMISAPHRGQQASQIDRDEDAAPHQNVCPIEKKNWKWLILCGTQL